MSQSKCMELKSNLAKRQYQISNVDVKGPKGVFQIKFLNDRIHDLLDDLQFFECDGIEYIYLPLEEEKPSPKKTLNLDRETDKSKLFAGDRTALPKKKATVVNSKPTPLPPKKRSHYRR